MQNTPRSARARRRANPDNMAPSDEHQSLLELLAKVAEGNLQQNLQMQKLTENMNQMAQSVTSSRIEKRPVLQNCPKMKKGENLETWIQEVTLWDKTVTGEEALKYLKFREMVKTQMFVLMLRSL